MSVSVQHEEDASSIASFESSDSDEENSSKVHDEDYGMIREKSLTKTVDEIKAFRQKRIDGQDRTGVPYRPSNQASSDLCAHFSWVWVN